MAQNACLARKHRDRLHTLRCPFELLELLGEQLTSLLQQRNVPGEAPAKAEANCCIAFLRFYLDPRSARLLLYTHSTHTFCESAGVMVLARMIQRRAATLIFIASLARWPTS